jgi:hypothetical protein
VSELGFCVRGWFSAFLTWLLEPTEDAREREEKRRKMERLRDANNVLELERRKRRG